MFNVSSYKNVKMHASIFSKSNENSEEKCTKKGNAMIQARLENIW